MVDTKTTLSSDLVKETLSNVLLLESVLEILGESILEFEFLSNKLWYEGQVQENGNHIRLLHIILLIDLITLDQVGPIRYITWDVLEISEVGRVGQDDIIRHTLNRFLGWLNNIKNIRNFLRNDLKAISVLEVFVFFNEPVGVGQSKSSEEEW